MPGVAPQSMFVWTVPAGRDGRHEAASLPFELRKLLLDALQVVHRHSSGSRASRDELARVVADLNEMLTRALPALQRGYAAHGLQVAPVKPIPPVRM